MKEIQASAFSFSFLFFFIETLVSPQGRKMQKIRVGGVCYSTIKESLDSITSRDEYYFKNVAFVAHASFRDMKCDLKRLSTLDFT